MTKRVLIAGGGVAALEAALALRALVEERVEIELLAPEPHFWYRPLSVSAPFELGETRRYELARLADAAGASFTLGALKGVDSGRYVAKTTAGELPYDALLVAVGADATPALADALTFRGPADTHRFRALLRDLAAGAIRRVAFCVPWSAAWSLPVYELALMTAKHLEQLDEESAELTVVTPEDEPLKIFGNAAGQAVRDLLAEHEIALQTGTYPTGFADGELSLLPAGRLAADAVVALPRLRGPRLDGLPQDVDGFIPVDRHGRVRGVDGVYAAGDITTFPVKQGGIATQMADAAAEAIASRLGADVRPRPFRPVLRGLLLTGGTPRYLRRELASSGSVDSQSPDPLWWPPAKIAGRHLSPFLSGLAGAGSPPGESARAGMIDVHVELSSVDLAGLGRLPLEAFDHGDDTAGERMSDPLVVAPEDTLGEVADKMRDRDTGSVAVADYGRLVGILTSRDLLRAFAARVHPSEARVREWMTADPVAVPPEATAEAAAFLMSEHGIHHLPVVEGGRPVGMLGYRQAVRRARAGGVGLGF